MEHVEYNPKSVDYADGREAAVDNALAQHTAGCVTRQDPVVFLVKNCARTLLHLDQRAGPVGEEGHEIGESSGAAARHDGGSK